MRCVDSSVSTQLCLALCCDGGLWACGISDWATSTAPDPPFWKRSRFLWPNMLGRILGRWNLIRLLRRLSSWNLLRLPKRVYVELPWHCCHSGIGKDGEVVVLIRTRVQVVEETTLRSRIRKGFNPGLVGSATRNSWTPAFKVIRVTICWWTSSVGGSSPKRALACLALGAFCPFVSVTDVLLCYKSKCIRLQHTLEYIVSVKLNFWWYGHWVRNGRTSGRYGTLVCDLWWSVWGPIPNATRLSLQPGKP